MTFILLPAVGSLTFNIGNFIAAHPGLINEIAGHALAHALYSHIRRGSRGGISRRESRKSMNRRRRWFVDNIILHHKRLHDRNRAVVISNARTRALAKRKVPERNPLSLQASSLQHDRDGGTKWRNAVNLKERGVSLRGTTDSKRLRARSRWLSVMGKTSS